MTGAAWLSGDGGTTWTLAVPPGATPAGHGAQAQISGVAVTGGRVHPAARPRAAAAREPGDVYRSANGTAWTFEATLAAAGRLRRRAMVQRRARPAP